MTRSNMKGKICLVTGSSSGIGKASVVELAKKGATVVMICRNRKKGEAVRTEIKEANKDAKVDLIIADLSELSQVHRAAKEFKEKYSQLHVLVNNAGGINSDRKVTPDGFEYTFATNYLASFLLTDLLLDTLKASSPSRIINVSSTGHKMGTGTINFDDLQTERKYNYTVAYAQSKLALIFFTYELAERLKSSGVTVNTLHPGAVNSGFNNGFKGIARLSVGIMYAITGISAEKGAETILYLATSSEVEGVSGKYFINKKAVPSSKTSYDPDIRQRLWKVTEGMMEQHNYA
ncbi:SDR family oxidoreductase [Paenibacillus camerounensis]|uniref:SDR family oxidoreductase n=1 Tax=Paenibacillus camerounensis TaxID=1243663 RepID=UPI0005A67CA9|nr:SDR family oxidoreductase [Paenibacillus camerounensis]